MPCAVCGIAIAILAANSKTCSLYVFDLRTLSLAPELRRRCSLQVYVKESADVLRCHGYLAAAINAQKAKGPHHTHQKRALQHRSVVAEPVVTCTSDLDHQPAV